MDEEEYNIQLNEDRLYRLARTKRQIYNSAFFSAHMSLATDIEVLRIYWNQTEDFLRGNMEKRKEEREKSENESQTREFWHLDRAIADELIQESKTFSQLIRGAFVITLFSFFESRFTEFAQLLAGDSSLTFDGVDKIKDYLVGIQKVDFPFGRSKAWYELQAIRELRNCIVHNQSNLSRLTQTRKRRLESYIKGHPYISFRDDTLHIEEFFIDHILSVIDDVCWSFLVSVSDRFVKETF